MPGSEDEDVNSDGHGLGFAHDEAELADRRARARAVLVGRNLDRVEYLDLDYRGWDLGYRDQDVRRRITDAGEWDPPTWDAGFFHHVDYGVEFSLDTGAVWSLTWDPPGRVEGLRIQAGPANPSGALWDVTDRQPWRDLHAAPIRDVLLRYHPWDPVEGGFWCSRVTLVFPRQHVEVLLGDRAPGSDGSLVPSADNVVVLWHPTVLPAWENTDDLV